MSDSLGLYGLQHTRPPCPSPTPGACLNSCPLSRWCHPTISSSVIPSPPAFHLSQDQGLFQWEFFVSGGQSIGASASASILPMNIQGPISFRMDWLDLFAVQVILNSCLQHHSSKASILGHSAGPNLTCIHDYWKNHSFNWTDLCWQINVSAF